MKILYIGQLNEGGTCRDRMLALSRQGHEVFGFNVLKYNYKNKYMAAAQFRLKWKMFLSKLNYDLIKYAGSFEGFDLVWVDKGIYIFSDVVDFMKKKSKLGVLHFTPDAQMIAHKSRHFFESLALYDFVVTTKSFEVDLYKSTCAGNVILSQQSYCPIRYKNPLRVQEFESDVGFIGHYERYYGEVVASLSGVSGCRVWGAGWLEAGNRLSVGAEFEFNDGLWRGDYVNALATFNIGLGLLAKYIPERHTTRSFEIPAAGSFMLAERTDEHLAFFEEGLEAEFFDGVDELKDKVNFYKTNPSAREKIAIAGRKRCIDSGYDTDSVLKKILGQVIKEAVN